MELLRKLSPAKTVPRKWDALGVQVYSKMKSAHVVPLLQLSQEDDVINDNRVEWIC